jgi:molybdopterin/thiamine biosynthesis adenylyltransferase
MITIVGLGALGSHVALFLRNEDKMKLIDFDKVEQKNILAQFHSKMGLGRNKALALNQAMLGLFGLMNDGFAAKLAKDNRDVILGGSVGSDLPKLLLDCTDNAEARRLIQDYAKKHKVPCLHGALSADGTFARVIWTEHFVLDEEGTEGEATCIDGEHLPFFAMAASVMSVEAQRFLKTGKKCSFQLTPSGLTRLA